MQFNVQLRGDDWGRKGDLKALFMCNRSVGYTIEHCYGPNPHPRDMRKRAYYPLQARGSVGDYSHQHGELVDRQKASYESDANAAENHSSAWVEAHFDRRFNATL